MIEMKSDQEKLFKKRLDKIPEIRITVDAIVDFVNTYSLEENIDFKQVINHFHALEEKDKEVVLESLKTKNHGPSFEEK